MTPARLATIKEILDAFARSGAEELEVSEGTLRLRILKRRGAPASVSLPRVTGELALTADAAPVEAPLSPEPLLASGVVVKATMHGVFHRAPTPGAEPFVTVGGNVARGQQLCILEAMKVFNALAAPHDGVIARIHVDNGEDVMAGQPLFTLDAVQHAVGAE